MDWSILVILVCQVVDHHSPPGHQVVLGVARDIQISSFLMGAHDGRKARKYCCEQKLSGWKIFVLQPIPPSGQDMHLRARTVVPPGRSAR